MEIHTQEQPQSAKRQRVIINDGQLCCTICQEHKPTTEFRGDVSKPSGRRSQCKQCFNRRQKELCRSPSGFTRQLLGSARTRAKQEKMTFDISTEFILEKWEKLNFSCAYSFKPTNMRSHTAWTVSIERLNDNEGYTKDNVTLVAQRFNVPAKWSREKFLQVPNKVKEYVDLAALENSVIQARYKPHERKEYPKRQFRGPDEAGLWLCYCCNSWKTKENFCFLSGKNMPQSNCNQCQVKQGRLWRDTLRGFVLSLLRDCSRTTQRRNTKGRSLEFALTLDHILDMILKQRGRCYLSGIPLVFRSNSEWKCSIERIDNRKGYVPGNVCLICAEFQSGDSSQHKNVDPADIEGTPQWTREIVLECWPELATITY